VPEVTGSRIVDPVLNRNPRRSWTASAALLPLAALLVAGPVPTAGAATAARPIAYTAWDSEAELATGSFAAVRIARDALRLEAPSGTRRYAGRSWDFGRWTSPWTTPGFSFTELVPSWQARTPEGTFVEVQVRGRSAAGRSSWDTLGRWASGDAGFRRTSQGPQTDDLARVATDTFVADGSFDSWQLRITLNRLAGTSRTPRVDAAGAMVSRIPASTAVATSRPGVARGLTLPVPAYSQMAHDGDYPEYDGGGEAWCSPTSTTMVLGYYDALPAPADYAWVGANHADAEVDHVARMTYDHGYDGTGNWPFNTAYAATRTDQAFVTRFASLRGVERFVKVGIPVIVSLTYGAGGLDGSPLSRGTNGHLLVVVGFTDTGDVVVNDPAAPDRAGVRRTYDRGQLENAWLKRGSAGGSGGVAYVIRDAAHPLPARNGATNW
jgi:hypothetical protein